MKQKETYTAPSIKVIPMQMEGLLETLSLPIGGGSSGSGGDAKGGWFDEDDEAENNRIWGPHPYDL